MKKEYQINSLADVISTYNAAGINGMNQELSMMRVLLRDVSLSDHIKAEMIVKGGHQHRLQCAKAKPAAAALVSAIEKTKLWTKNYASKTFEDLYADVESAITGIGYAGQIAKYDFAKRIGTVVGVQPTDYVYLHSGALIGAQRLLNIPSLKEGRYPVTMFTSFFPTLNAMEIEDILCVFHDIFAPGGIVIRYFFDDPPSILPCHIFWLDNQTKRKVNSILKNNNLPTLKIKFKKP